MCAYTIISSWNICRGARYPLGRPLVCRLRSVSRISCRSWSLRGNIFCSRRENLDYTNLGIYRGITNVTIISITVLLLLQSFVIIIIIVIITWYCVITLLHNFGALLLSSRLYLLLYCYKERKLLSLFSLKRETLFPHFSMYYHCNERNIWSNAGINTLNQRMQNKNQKWINVLYIKYINLKY